MSTEPNVSTFSVFDYLEGTVYPTEKVVIHTNSAAAYNIKKAHQQKKAPEQSDLDAFEASAITFELRGKSPEDIRLLMDRPEDMSDEDWMVESQSRLMAANIVSVTRADGAVDKHAWSAEEVKSFSEKVNLGEFAKLIEALYKVNFDAKLFDDAVDAGFPSGSADEG